MNANFTSNTISTISVGYMMASSIYRKQVYSILNYVSKPTDVSNFNKNEYKVK